MTHAYIYDACRSPRGRGKPDGALHPITPVALLAQNLSRILSRNNLPPDALEDVVTGVVEPYGEQGADIARAAVLAAGLDHRIPGVQVSRFCASGLEAVNIAAAKVMSGEADLVVGGGVESMSRIPLFSGGGAWLQDPALIWDSFFIPQGVSADLICALKGYSRVDVDYIALESQRRAARAWEEGRFARSIEPVYNTTGRLLLDRDEHMRPQVTAEQLAALPPVFGRMAQEDGYATIARQRWPQIETIPPLHTAGNSSGIVDGTASVLIGSKEAGAAHGLTPRARIRAMASIGTDPTLMLSGPMPASYRALAKAGLEVADIDLFEVNEAFAAVILMYLEEMGVDHACVNVNGGAIALGHPVGATGAMLLGTLLDEMERQDKSLGLVTLCVGAGMGTATIIERI